MLNITISFSSLPCHYKTPNQNKRAMFNTLPGKAPQNSAEGCCFYGRHYNPMASIGSRRKETSALYFTLCDISPNRFPLTRKQTRHRVPGSPYSSFGTNTESDRDQNEGRHQSNRQRRMTGRWLAAPLQNSLSSVQTPLIIKHLLCSSARGR